MSLNLPKRVRMVTGNQLLRHEKEKKMFTDKKKKEKMENEKIRYDKMQYYNCIRMIYLWLFFNFFSSYLSPSCERNPISRRKRVDRYRSSQQWRENNETRERNKNALSVYVIFAMLIMTRSVFLHNNRVNLAVIDSLDRNTAVRNSTGQRIAQNIKLKQ